jgi:hypothetical protein
MLATASSPNLVREKRAIAISLAVTLIFGWAYILWRWGARGGWDDGVLRCVAFACAMVAIHVWGYRAYRRQWLKEASIAPPEGSSAPLDDECRTDTTASGRISWPAILAQQAFSLFFASILLDGGAILQLCLGATLVYWTAVLTGLALRRGQTTPTDRLLLNVGYWPLTAIIAMAQAVVWAMKGL